MANMSSGGGLSNGKLEMASATEADVLSGETFYAQNKELKTGAMANQGAWSSTIDPGTSVTIPQGYHDGNGKVTANNTVSQTTDSQSVANGVSTANRDVYQRRKSCYCERIWKRLWSWNLYQSAEFFCWVCSACFYGIFHRALFRNLGNDVLCRVWDKCKSRDKSCLTCIPTRRQYHHPLY